MNVRPDFSAEILSGFYGRNKILRIALLNGEILHGSLVGFFYGDPGKKEPYVVAWRFISETQIDDYRNAPEKYMEFGRKIRQSEIAGVNFK
jgi:hypothetical protein